MTDFYIFSPVPLLIDQSVPNGSILRASPAYFREYSRAPLALLTDRQWRHLTEHSVVPGRNGTYSPCTMIVGHC
jgi:hypothetical protein